MLGSAAEPEKERSLRGQAVHHARSEGREHAEPPGVRDLRDLSAELPGDELRRDRHRADFRDRGSGVFSVLYDPGL